MIFKLYQKHVFPHLLNQVMQTPSFMQARGELLAPIHGNCLEIGFGTGINLAFYQNISQLYALEPNAELWQLAQSRLDQSNFNIEQIQAFADHIPLEDGSVDNLVSTWTMCSIAKLEPTFTELHRILSPDGTFHFVEHVLSDQPKLQRWQHTLTPVQKVIADGCHLNRNIEKLIEDAGFEFIEKRYFEAQGIPKLASRMLFGRVKKRS